MFLMQFISSFVLVLSMIGMLSHACLNKSPRSPRNELDLALQGRRWSPEDIGKLKNKEKDSMAADD